jgi:hypothetical protein
MYAENRRKYEPVIKISQSTLRGIRTEEGQTPANLSDTLVNEAHLLDWDRRGV